MGNQSSKSHKDKYRKNVHWKSAERPTAPGKPYLLPGLPSDEPDVVTIKWQKPTHDGGSAIVGYVVEHKKAGSPSWSRANQQLIQFTELAVSGLEPGWRYQFRVIAENAVGHSDPSEPSDPLTVTLQKPTSTLSAPKFSVELEDVGGIENEKVEFKVRFIGTPIPQISWFKDGFEIFSSRRAKIITDCNTSTLIFYQASLTDEGEIKCTATNRVGYSFTKAKLTIEAPPKIRLPRQYEDGLIIEAEEVIRLKVGLAGRPSPIVEWSHNGELIENNQRYEIITTDKNSTLKISNTNRSDRGEYNLRAINDLGEDSTAFLVTVTSRPMPPGKVLVNILLGNTVTLSWGPSEDDGGCKIGNYIVEYYRIGWGVWLKAATCRTLAVTLNDLIPGSEYKFRVKAENPYGVSDASLESDTLFVPDIKRGIIEPIKNKTKSLLDVELNTPSAPKRRQASQSPSRTKLTENIEQTKLSPIPQIKLNTGIFDDNTIERDMSYGTSDFYNFKEVPSSSLHEKSGLEDQVRQLRNAKQTVKFEDKNKIVNEPIYANLPKDIEEQSKRDEFKFSGKRTYLDLSRTNNAQSSIQNSSEFMLVLYPNKDEKSTDKNDSFELDDFFEPPKPLSQSAPEINAMIPEAPILRAAVSSTELLYERAMARFYKAVEYEQSENARKRSVSVDQEAIRRRSFSVDQETKRLSIQADPQETAMTHLRINSLTENEKKSVLRRRLSGENPSLHITIPKRLSFNRDEDLEEFDRTFMNTIKNELNTPDMLSASERSPSPYASPSDEKYSDDYTESTQSSEENEDEKPTRRSRSLEKDNTHIRMLSPYRQPQKDEAAEVLTKNKSPLPDPNFVPKPILKRPGSADGRKSNPLSPVLDIFMRRSLSPSPSPPTNMVHRKSVEIDDVPIIIHPKGEIAKQPSPKKDIKEETQVKNDLPEIKVEQPKVSSPKIPPIIEPELEEEQFDPEILRRAEQTKRKLLEKRQSSIEESKVVADFYGDIIRMHSASKPKVPIYMDPEALKKLEVEEEESQIDSGVMSACELSPKSTLTRPLSPNVEKENRSPSPFSRRASDVSKTRTFSPPPSNERRASETSKFLASTKASENFSNLPLKDTMKTFSSNYNRLELNISPSPLSAPQTAQLEQNIENTLEENRGRLVTKSVTGTIPKQKRKQSKSRSRDGSMARPETRASSVTRPMSITPTTVVSNAPLSNVNAFAKREKSSSRTRNRSESKSPAAMNRKVIFNRFAPSTNVQQIKSFKKDVTPSSQTPISSRTVTPNELQEIVDVKVKSSMTYATDVSILIFATYIYLFKSALLALPILILLIYRQIADKVPNWLKRKPKKED